MLTCQKEHFQIPSEITYLNGAYMSPSPKKVEAAGIAGVQRMSHPYIISPQDFYDDVKKVQQLFAKLIGVKKYQRIAIIAAVSYGVANVVKNLRPKPNGNIVLLHEQFPSNVYSWQRYALENNSEIRTIHPPESIKNRAEIWNQSILESIDNQTIAVSMCHVHWADGTKFNLKEIGKKCREVGAKLIIDGTQSIGAMPFDFEGIQPDALICGGYKWLLGPYSIGAAYYGECFDGGIPIEESWINRLNSSDFSNLVNYQEQYEPMAGRYNVGQSGNFALIPMFKAALEFLLEMGVENIQNYCKRISEPAIQKLTEMGCQVEELEFRGSHLFGIRLGENFDLEKLKTIFKENNVFVSIRGNAIRIAPNIYNDENDFKKLVKCFEAAIEGGSFQEPPSF